MTDLAEQLIGEEEGRDPCVFPDSRGYQTIAIGCLVDRRFKGAGLCDAAITAQFAHDSMTARAIAGGWPKFTTMSDIRQAVCISMAFQLSNKPRGWPQFMAALAMSDYVAAAVAGLDTEWANTQTPKRAKREMDMLRTNLWIPHQ